PIPESRQSPKSVEPVTLSESDDDGRKSLGIKTSWGADRRSGICLLALSAGGHRLLPAPRVNAPSAACCARSQEQRRGDGRRSGRRRSGGLPRAPQRLPANQRAPEREERLVDVGPLVIPHAEAAKLTEPGEGALHDPPPPAQATPMLGAAHGQQGHDMTSPETAPNGGCVVAAISEHTVRPLPWSAPFAVQRGNRIHQR